MIFQVFMNSSICYWW